MTSRRSCRDASTSVSLVRRSAVAAGSITLAAICILALRSRAIPFGQLSLAAAGQKRALIVAISNYAPSTGWRIIHSSNDVPLIRDALVRHGFAPAAIHELTDSAATRKGILDAVRQHLLEPAQPGDVLVLHYSGHGQQITDDGDDEIDGYDEALVPYDAPMTPDAASRYAGEKHLRDDELNTMMLALRRKVGPSGNVVLFIDSCYSGTISRGGDADPLGTERGGPPFGPPKVANAAGSKPGSGFYESGTRGAGPTAEPQLAPYIVFSAARNNDRAFETITPDGRSVGSLSFALGAALAAPDVALSYRTVFERVKWEMQKWVRNEPQLEGDWDSELFSGHAVRQVPYLEVLAVRDGGNEATLAAGSVFGLLKGAVVEFHQPGTLVPADASKIAAGRVVDTQPLRATVAIDPAGAADRLRTSRAFVNRFTFGDLRIRLGLKGLDADVRTALVQALENVAAVEIGDDRPDVVAILATTAGRPELVVQTAADAVPLLEPGDAANPQRAAACVASRLQDYARNRYLRRLSLRDPKLDAQLDVVPLAWKNCRNAAQPTPQTCDLVEEPLSRYMSAGHQLELPIGTPFRLKLRSGAQREFITVLDLSPDGDINVLWPPPGAKEEASPRSAHDLGEGFQVTGPAGIEMLLLVATERWVDFGPFQSFPCGASRGASSAGPLGPFDVLFDQLAVQSRSERIGFAKGSVSTSAVPFTVIAASSRPAP